MLLTVFTVLVLALCLCLSSVDTYPNYQLQIPNGDSVPNPCESGQIWQGVGHINPAGAGPRNQFGLNFADNNFQWTLSLCQADSDGDGLTNGQELGDPNCVWSASSSDPPERTEGITHPGVNNNNPNCTVSDCFSWLRRIVFWWRYI